VATETFFEKSRQFREMKPQLYEALKDYYKLDPAEW
jgi:Mlc titration factor MtfA (ptsG expression regulator)